MATSGSARQAHSGKKVQQKAEERRGAEPRTQADGKERGRQRRRSRATAMLWYEPEQYAGVIKIMSDRKSYPSTYDAWLGPAAREERRLQGDGWRVIRVAIEPASFRAWCAGRGFRRDSEARKAYAREEATQVLRKER